MKKSDDILIRVTLINASWQDMKDAFVVLWYIILSPIVLLYIVYDKYLRPWVFKISDSMQVCFRYAMLGFITPIFVIFFVGFGLMIIIQPFYLIYLFFTAGG